MLMHTQTTTSKVSHKLSFASQRRTKYGSRFLGLFLTWGKNHLTAEFTDLDILVLSRDGKYCFITDYIMLHKL